MNKSECCTVNHLPLIERNIVLVGFMGVGKTTVGRLLAKKLYRDFIDIDAEIERTQGTSIPTLFEQHGEPYFRQLEKDHVLRESAGKMKVISLGGGAFTQEDIRSYCLKHCLVIFLDIRFDSWQDRIHMLAGNRPILKGKSTEELQELYTARQEAYALNHSQMHTDSLTAEEVAVYLKESLITAYELEK